MSKKGRVLVFKNRRHKCEEDTVQYVPETDFNASLDIIDHRYVKSWHIIYMIKT